MSRTDRFSQREFQAERDVAPGPDVLAVVAASMLRQVLTDEVRRAAAAPGRLTVVRVQSRGFAAAAGRAWLSEIWNADLYAENRLPGQAPYLRLAEGEPKPRVAPCVAVSVPLVGGESSDTSATVRRALSNGDAVVAFAYDEEIEDELDLPGAADLTVDLSRPGPEALAEAAAQLCGGATSARFPPHLVSQLQAADYWLAWRHGQPGDDWLRRLRNAAERRTTASPALSGPTLDDLGGMTGAVEAGREIVRDLGDLAARRIAWADCMRGLLLHGRPGTGKTLFAGALARSAGVPLLTGSLAEWQRAKDGHLGTTLRAMHERFAAARAAAPCIMFIDEIDSFGDRATFDARHRDYSTQVVNALLEHLDGLGGREGVVVVAACNDVDRLDEAIIRSGRLERVVHIPLPDQAGLERILRHHLGDDLPEADLRRVAEECLGTTGADVAKLVRDARRRARRQGRSVSADDLLVGALGEMPDRVAPADLQLAVHEAGHAVVAEIGQPGSVVRVRINRALGVGETVHVKQGEALLTAATLRQELREKLAGRASEQVLLGHISAGSGIGDHSDLAQATLLAVRAISSFGFDEDGLLWTGEPAVGELGGYLAIHPGHAQKVRNYLNRAFAEACETVTEHKVAVQRVADRLLACSSLSGAEVAELLKHEAEDRLGRAGQGLA